MRFKSGLATTMCPWCLRALTECRKGNQCRGATFAWIKFDADKPVMS